MMYTVIDRCPHCKEQTHSVECTACGQVLIEDWPLAVRQHENLVKDVILAYQFLLNDEDQAALVTLEGALTELRRRRRREKE